MYSRVYRGIHGIKGYSRIYKAIQGYKRVFNAIQGYLRVFKAKHVYLRVSTRVFKGIHG